LRGIVPAEAQRGAGPIDVAPNPSRAAASRRHALRFWLLAPFPLGCAASGLAHDRYDTGQVLCIRDAV